jgi:hypothetical protein
VKEYIGAGLFMGKKYFSATRMHYVYWHLSVCIVEALWDTTKSEVCEEKPKLCSN